MPKPKRTVTHEIHFRLSPDVIAAIRSRAQTHDQAISAVAEKLIRNAIAAEEADTIERAAVPVIRQAVGEDQAAALQVLREQIRADVQEITNKHTDRLAKLLVRAGRASSLAWRLVFKLMQLEYTPEDAQRWYEEEAAKAGKAMASHLESGKEIAQ